MGLFMVFFKLGSFALGSLLFSVGISFGNVSSIECKVPVSEKICYTLGEESRDCVEPPREMVPYKLGEQIELIFSAAPPAMQRAMCALDHLFISKSIMEHASGFQRATEIHLSWLAIHSLHVSFESFVEQEFSSYGTGATFADLGLGYDPQDLRLSDAHILEYEVEYTKERIKGLNYPLAYLMFHELAHLMEQHPKFNNHHGFGYFSCNWQYQSANNYRLHALDRRIKGYAMVLDEHPKLGQDSSVLIELANGNYATFYATANAAEDFAELVTVYIMHNHFGVNYRISKEGGLLFDLESQLQNERMQPKLDIVKLALAFPETSKKLRRDIRLDRKLCRETFDPSLLTVLP